MTLSTKDQLIKRFLQASNKPISGQQLADELGLSRTAIWKHMQTLQQEGFVFETVKKKGYMLVKAPELFQQTIFQQHLKTERYGQTIYTFDQVDSTQVVAQQYVREQAPDGTVILAEEQFAGRGRMLRPWDSSKGNGIWMTVILRPNLLPHQAPQLTLVAAVAVVNAIKSLQPNLNPAIKWPNDLLFNDRKFTGILTEMLSETDRIEAILLGIGINVNHKLEDFPKELHSIATSLSIEAGEMISREQLTAQILFYLEHYVTLYEQKGFAAIKPLWEEASCTIGHNVRATTLREVIEGKAIGITESGVLEIELVDGSIKGVYSADIEMTK